MALSFEVIIPQEYSQVTTASTVFYQVANPLELLHNKGKLKDYFLFI